MVQTSVHIFNISDFYCNNVALSNYIRSMKLKPMMKTKSIFLGMLSAAFVFTACKDDEPDAPIIPNEEEVITTLSYTLVPDGGGDTVVLSFQDLDGDGGNAPIISDGVLQANTVYTGTLELLNELVDPTEDITEEVAEEADEHQFFFPTTIVGLDVDYGDMDADGNPIGIETTLSTLDTDSGTLTIILRHEPDKGAAGVADGDIANAGGETDIEVIFNVEVQ